MFRPFKSTSFRKGLEARLDELTTQTEDLRKQVVDRAPGVRDQLVDMLPDKGQLRDLRDDLFERLPDTVQDKLPEKVKPKHSRLKKVALLGAVTGAGAAALAVIKGRTQTPPVTDPFPRPPRPAPATSDVDVDAPKPPPQPVKKASPKK